MLPCPSDSPLMTASSSKSSFSMTTKFPKALAAAGLAAALVGCGSSNEAARTPDPAPAQPQPPVPVNPGPTPAQQRAMAWRDAFDEYQVDFDIDLPSKVNLETEPGRITLEYDNDNERGDDIDRLNDRWFGEQYEDIDYRGLTASGGVITNYDGDPVTKGATWQALTARQNHDDFSDLLFGSVVDMTAPAGGTGTLVVDVPADADTITTTLHMSNVDISDTARTRLGKYTIGSTAIQGELFGERGAFTCTADNACTVSFNRDGFLELKVAANGQDLTFTTAANTEDIEDLEVTTPQTSYAEFGYWVTVNDSDGLTKIDTFARDGELAGLGRDLTNDPEGLRGSARYDGHAAGYYLLGREHNGEFTANVSLEADFDDNEIDGEIDDFRSITNTAHNNELDRWQLDLEEADILTGSRASFARTFDGNTSSSRTSRTGDWEGRFYGNTFGRDDLEGVDDGDLTMNRDYPQTVVGEFNGYFHNGEVIGAFGAEHEHEN